MKKISLFIIFGILIFGTGCYRTQQSAETQNTTLTTSDSLSGSANQTPLDSLLQWAAIAPLDTNLALVYYDIAEIYKDHDFDKAKQYYLKLNNLSEELDWDNGRYLFTKAYTLLLTQKMSQENAKEEQRKNEVTETKDNEMDIGKMQTVSIARSLGETLIENLLFEEILQYYMKALPESRNDREALGLIDLMIATVYKNIHSPEKAVEFCEKAVVLLKDDPRALVQLARIYTVRFQFEKAGECFEKAIDICKQQNDLFLLGTVYSLFSYNCLYTGDFEKGAILAQQGLEICHKTDNPFSIPDLIFLCKVEQMQNHYEQAEHIIQEAIQVARKHEIREAEKVCMMILSELALTQHKPLPQFQDKEALYQLDDLTAIEATYWVATEMETAYETAKKELEIEKQQNIIHKQNTQRNILTGCMVFSGIILLLLWFLLRLRRHRNYELAEINATKDKFFSIISHDMKNPAIVQRDTLQLLVKNAHSWNVEAVAEYHNELLKSAEEEVELLLNLLSWSQLQTGRISFNPVTFVASDLIPNLSLIRKMAENKNITLNISIPDDALITGDRKMLDTIIRNLLTNAVKFTPTSGTVHLEVLPIGLLRATTPPRNDHTKCVVSVTDTGIGMTPEELQNLFRLDSSHTKRGTAGEASTGLGLIVCRELLEKHGTVLQVESEEENGSRFWFEI